MVIVTSGKSALKGDGTGLETALPAGGSLMAVLDFTQVIPAKRSAEPGPERRGVDGSTG